MMRITIAALASIISLTVFPSEVAGFAVSNNAYNAGAQSQADLSSEERLMKLLTKLENLSASLDQDLDEQAAPATASAPVAASTPITNASSPAFVSPPIQGTGTTSYLDALKTQPTSSTPRGSGFTSYLDGIQKSQPLSFSSIPKPTTPSTTTPAAPYVSSSQASFKSTPLSGPGLGSYLDGIQKSQPLTFASIPKATTPSTPPPQAKTPSSSFSYLDGLKSQPQASTPSTPPAAVSTPPPTAPYVSSSQANFKSAPLAGPGLGSYLDALKPQSTLSQPQASGTGMSSYLDTMKSPPPSSSYTPATTTTSITVPEASSTSSTLVVHSYESESPLSRQLDAFITSYLSDITTQSVANPPAPTYFSNDVVDSLFPIRPPAPPQGTYFTNEVTTQLYPTRPEAPPQGIYFTESIKEQLYPVRPETPPPESYFSGSIQNSRFL